jgi:hypothetical protein
LQVNRWQCEFNPASDKSEFINFYSMW